MNKKEVEIKKIERILKLIDAEIENNNETLSHHDEKIWDMEYHIKHLKFDIATRESENKTLLKEKEKYKKIYKSKSGFEYKVNNDEDDDFDEINIFMN